MPVAVVVARGGISTKAGGWENVGIAALAGMKHLPSILLNLLCFFLVLFLLLFVGVALLEKGDGLGLSGYLRVWENGFRMFCLSSMCTSIFLTSNGNCLTCEPHRLHIDDYVA